MTMMKAPLHTVSQFATRGLPKPDSPFGRRPRSADRGLFNQVMPDPNATAPGAMIVGEPIRLQDLIDAIVNAD